MSGSCVILASSLDLDDFWNYLTNPGLTQFNGSPTVLKSILGQARGHASDIEHSPLRVIFAGIGKIEPELADEIESIFGVPVIEAYSTTETGRIFSNPLPPGRAKRGTVGLPINCEVRIRSLAGDFLPTGERGEILVRGPQIFEGYENDPEANSQAFVDGWFRTGDEGFLDTDGYLTLTGRIKEVISRGGEKVSPAEVDAALLEYPGIRDAAVFPVAHRTLGEEVAAAVVMDQGTEISDGDLTRFLLTRLAGFKVPRMFVFADTIPRNEIGKVQRYSLAQELGLERDLKPRRGPDPGREPTPLESDLQRVWARTLRLDHVGLNDNYFMLGGDSLQAVALFMDIEGTLKRRLPVACLFEAGTVAEMAKLIEEEDTPGCMVAIQPEGTRPPFFCVHGNGGEVIGFYNLAKHLGDNQPFYGIQSVGWDGTVVPFTKSADMAAHYVAEMRKVQPEGPYYFGGYSTGGRIAVYMACQLREAGEEVALLALLDTYSYVGRRPVGFDIWRARRGDPRGARLLACALSYGWFRVRRGYDSVYTRIRRAVMFGIWEHYRRSGKPLPPYMRRPARANRLMRLEHSDMPVYGGDAVYFTADASPESKSHPDSRNNWNQVIKGRLEVVPVPGIHEQIIQEPYAQTLALELENALQAARTEEKAIGEV